MKKSMFGVSISSVVILVACASGGGKNWNSQMKSASKILSDLLPKVVLDKWEDSAKDQTDLKSLTTKLSGVSHGIDKETGVPSMDPSIKFVAKEFKKELTKAQFHMDSGKWQLAQAEVKRATQYCIACHSMTEATSSSFSFDLNPNLNGLNPYEKAIYFSAVRQFELSIVHYEMALNDRKWAKDNPELWNSGVIGMMAIAGRIKRSPDLILELASRFFDTGVYPNSLKRAARQWQRDAREWRKSKSARINLENTYKYMNKGFRSERSIKNSGLVQFLRASSNLNELLRMGAVGDINLQKSYYMSGQIAEALGEPSFSGFAEDYYSLCVERSKTSKTGKVCKDALEKLLKSRKG